MRKRLDVYSQQTRPLVDYYSNWAKAEPGRAPKYRAISGIGTRRRDHPARAGSPGRLIERHARAAVGTLVRGSRHQLQHQRNPRLDGRAAPPASPGRRPPCAHDAPAGAARGAHARATPAACARSAAASSAWCSVPLPVRGDHDATGHRTAVCATSSASTMRAVGAGVADDDLHARPAARDLRPARRRLAAPTPIACTGQSRSCRNAALLHIAQRRRHRPSRTHRAGRCAPCCTSTRAMHARPRTTATRRARRASAPRRSHRAGSAGRRARSAVAGRMAQVSTTGLAGPARAAGRTRSLPACRCRG